jgi:hypothetical protein
MKQLGVILATGLTLLIVFVVSIFSFFPGEGKSLPPLPGFLTGTEDPQSTIIIPVAPNLAQLETTLTEREAAHQARITELNKAVQEREAVYQAQIQELTAQISEAQTQLNDLKTWEQDLRARIAELETTRAERLATYQRQLEQVQAEYNTRSGQLQAQLSEAQNQLINARTQLGQ